MGIFDRFKKDDTKPKLKAQKPAALSEKKAAAKPVDSTKVKVDEEKKAAVVKPKKDVLKGFSQQAEQILIKPLVTEKAASLGAVGKYIFVVDSRMNKIEVKKAMRKVYGVDPVKVNIVNVSGKNIRYGRVHGQTKAWKKAIVTLKPGDKIEIYEGV